MARTKRSGAISGRLMHDIADSFRVLPILDRSPSGKYLRDWAAGSRLNPRARKRVLADIAGAALEGVGGPLAHAELVSVAAGLLHSFCNWFDAVRPSSSERSELELAVEWQIEHTLELFGMILGIARYAWGEPKPERVTLKAYFPRGTDATAVPTSLLDSTIEKISKSARAERMSLTGFLDRHRDDPQLETASGAAVDEVSPTKPATIKSWRIGKTLPNGERVDQLERASDSALLRVEIGLRSLVERVASFLADRSSPLGLAANRDATFMWLAHAEWTAFNAHRAFADNDVPPAEAVRFFARGVFSDWLFPRLDRPGARRTSADLPYRLRQKTAVRLDFKFPDLKEPQSALIFVEPAKDVNVAFERVPKGSGK